MIEIEFELVPENKIVEKYQGYDFSVGIFWSLRTEL
jgi:hypothetical protein